MDQMTNCEYLANILKGKSQVDDGVCSVMVDRKDISATIGSRPFHSLSHMFNFEIPDNNGNSLITGEMVLLESEVQKVLGMLANAGIIVGALHNHWLYDNPRLMYIHIESVTKPDNFAHTMAGILSNIK